MEISLRIFSINLPEYAPEHWRYIEPINRQLDLVRIRAELAGRKKSILWKRKSKPKGWGVIKKKNITPLGDIKHGYHSLYLSAKENGEIEAVTKYLKHVARSYGNPPVFSVCHK